MGPVFLMAILALAAAQGKFIFKEISRFCEVDFLGKVYSTIKRREVFSLGCLYQF